MALWSFRDVGPSTAPAVVLLHSIATQGDIWAAQVGPWSLHNRLIVVDLPGHGNTAVDPAVRTLDDYADGLERLIVHIGLQSVVVVGLSLGGMIAQTFALRFPVRVRGLVIANSLARVSGVAQKVWNARKQQVAAFGMQSQITDTLARWFTPEFASVSPLTLQWIGAMIGSTRSEGYLAAVAAIQKLDVLDRLNDLTCRALVVTGRADALVSLEVAKSLADRIPGAELVVLDAAAHLSNVEQPTAFCEAVGGFLKKVE